MGSLKAESELNVQALGRTDMDDNTLAQLHTISHQLQTRSYELAQAGENNDIALLMSALADTIEAIRSLGEDVNQLVGLKGLGRDGE